MSASTQSPPSAPTHRAHNGVEKTGAHRRPHLTDGDGEARRGALDTGVASQRQVCLGHADGQVAEPLGSGGERARGKSEGKGLIFNLNSTFRLEKKPSGNGANLPTLYIYSYLCYSVPCS